MGSAAKLAEFLETNKTMTLRIAGAIDAASIAAFRALTSALVELMEMSGTFARNIESVEGAGILSVHEIVPSNAQAARVLGYIRQTFEAKLKKLL